MSQQLVESRLRSTFKYRKLFDLLSERATEEGLNKLIRNYSEIVRSWNDIVHSEWLIRNYLAIKMIMSSTVMLSSLEFGKERNIRVTEPYLGYYALLNLARAVMFTKPSVDWNNGEIITATHTKIINHTSDAIGQFDKKLGKEIKYELSRAKDYRELFSYKFPANGIRNFTLPFNTVHEYCVLLAEFAQLQSEVLASMNFGKRPIQFELDNNILSKGYMYTDGTITYLDEEDWYRIGYYVRHRYYPTCLFHMLTEGMVEDYYGAWCPEDCEDPEMYNPDHCWSYIFPMP